MDPALNHIQRTCAQMADGIVHVINAGGHPLAQDAARFMSLVDLPDISNARTHVAWLRAEDGVCDLQRMINRRDADNLELWIAMELGRFRASDSYVQLCSVVAAARASPEHTCDFIERIHADLVAAIPDIAEDVIWRHIDPEHPFRAFANALDE